MKINTNHIHWTDNSNDLISRLKHRDNGVRSRFHVITNDCVHTNSAAFINIWTKLGDLIEIVHVYLWPFELPPFVSFCIYFIVRLYFKSVWRAKARMCRMGTVQLLLLLLSCWILIAFLRGNRKICNFNAKRR